MTNKKEIVEQLLFNFSDIEKSAYTNQKEQLKKGIILSSLNGRQIEHFQSNRLASNINKNLYYLISNIFEINQLDKIRGNLGKLLLFPEDLIQISTLDTNNNEIIGKHLLINLELEKINYNKICDMFKIDNSKPVRFKVKLVQEGMSRKKAEQDDLIFETILFYQRTLNFINEKLEILTIQNKKEILSERIKLWNNNLASYPNIVFDDVFELKNIEYRFNSELSNEKILKPSERDNSYLHKLKKIMEQLEYPEFWIS